MAYDAELTRLKAEQETAREQKDEAYRIVQFARGRLLEARNLPEYLSQEKERAQESHDEAWRHYLEVKRQNGPEIKALNEQKNQAYAAMNRAFAAAERAYFARDGALAKRHSQEGYDHRDDLREYSDQRRVLVDEIREARLAHEAARQTLQRLKEAIPTAEADIATAEERLESAQGKLNEAKEAHQQTIDAVKARVNELRAEKAQRRNDRRALARRAGVDMKFLERVWVRHDPDGAVNIYFGGVGRADGPGHGHYVMNAQGTVTYKREPFEAHGGHNFVDAHDDYSKRISQELSRGEVGFSCRFRGYDAYVESSKDAEGRQMVDIYYGPAGLFAHDHHHVTAYRDSPFEFISGRFEG